MRLRRQAIGNRDHGNNADDDPAETPNTTPHNYVGGGWVRWLLGDGGACAKQTATKAIEENISVAMSLYFPDTTSVQTHL
jgi:hypothetical protein